MAVTVALFDAARARLSERLDALTLDINLITFDADGNFDIDGRKVPATEVEVDYLWLGPDLAGGSVGNLPFDVALACKHVDVLQTFNAGLDNPAYEKIVSKGIRVCNSSAQSVAISEYVMAHALIEDDAMVAALDRGQLAAAVLDVFDPEPLPVENPL